MTSVKLAKQKVTILDFLKKYEVSLSVLPSALDSHPKLCPSCYSLIRHCDILHGVFLDSVGLVKGRTSDNDNEQQRDLSTVSSSAEDPLDSDIKVSYILIYSMQRYE
jgi:hypothetical protein